MAAWQKTMNEGSGTSRTKSTTERVQQVGMTKEANEKAIRLGEERKAAKAAKATTSTTKATSSASASSSSSSSSSSSDSEPTPSSSTPAPPKKRSLLRKIFRVAKKVIAPWRKWENIS